ncbi:hypothetical protein KIN20_001651 [Parelaphostrongylus tenuis]|uniref:Uncharacterized protein n=1 Tax=Parelaphostrongylus tenuis TaxID=148309 RepID=A0AAD5MMG4_PARTN|nr:hypothetical protein KIN20_001651 [Parelaphostrongylus tenuis]
MKFPDKERKRYTCSGNADGPRPQRASGTAEVRGPQTDNGPSGEGGTQLPPTSTGSSIDGHHPNGRLTSTRPPHLRFELCALVGYKRQVGRRHGHTDQSSARSNLEVQPATSKSKSRRNPEVRREQHKGQCAAKDDLTIFRYRSGHCLRQIQGPHSKNH